MPYLSKVNNTSIVVDRPSVPDLVLPDSLGLLFGGLKAEERILTIASMGQLVVMLSGNRVSSKTRTSESERSPSLEAEAWSSFFLISPRPAASPGEEMS